MDIFRLRLVIPGICLERSVIHDCICIRLRCFCWLCLLTFFRIGRWWSRWIDFGWEVGFFISWTLKISWFWGRYVWRSLGFIYCYLPATIDISGWCFRVKVRNFPWILKHGQVKIGRLINMATLLSNFDLSPLL